MSSPDDRDPAHAAPRDPASTSPEPPAARRKRSHRDLIAALTSGFVGALALGSSLYNVYLQRQQVSAAVWPSLEWALTPKDDGISFVVANRGIGPAVVKSFVVWVDDKKMHSWIEALRALDKTGRTDPDAMNDVVRTISPGGEVTAMSLLPGADTITILLERRRLSVEVCYCSTLDECWRLHVAEARAPSTTSVSGCPVDGEPFQAVNDRQLDTWLHYMQAKSGMVEGDGGRGDAQ
jgi:hypothetical protein